MKRGEGKKEGEKGKEERGRRKGGREGKKITEKNRYREESGKWKYRQEPCL